MTDARKSFKALYDKVEGTPDYEAARAEVRTEQLRARFERVTYARYVEQHNAGTAVDDNTEQVTPEGLFWRAEGGGYGVVGVNSAWWGFLQGALMPREPVAWLRDQRDGYEGRETFDPLVVLTKHDPGKGINGATYSPLYTTAPVPAASKEDMLLWPDGAWCYRHELPEMSHKSDDYETVTFGTPRYTEVLSRLESGVVP